VNIVKIGGNIVDNEDALHLFLSTIAQQSPCIIVHGGGKVATEIANKLGVESVMVEGRRITDKNTLEIATMVYGGLINKKIVAILQSFNTNAIGMTGADANCIVAKKRPVKDIDYGYVGDIELVHTEFLISCLKQNITPVMASLTHDKKGSLLNTNADTIAAQIAMAIAKTENTRLVYCFEKNGVLADANDNKSVIRTLNAQTYNELLLSGAIHKGMKPKLENAFLAKKSGVHKVFICHADSVHQPEQGTEIL